MDPYSLLIKYPQYTFVPKSLLYSFTELRNASVPKKFQVVVTPSACSIRHFALSVYSGAPSYGLQAVTVIVFSNNAPSVVSILSVASIVGKLTDSSVDVCGVDVTGSTGVLVGVAISSGVDVGVSGDTSSACVA